MRFQWLSIALAVFLLIGWHQFGQVLGGQPPATRLYASFDLAKNYQLRSDSLIDFYAAQRPGGYITVATNLYRRQNLEWVLAKLDTLMQNPSGDMFWMYNFIEVTFLGKDFLPDSTLNKMRQLWRTYTPYRGDTENHWAMYYSALYLITQMYPDEPGENWYNGRSSTENHLEARDYLISWMDLTTTIGQGEFDSPDYFGVYIVPMAQLFGFATDPAMKQRARMMLDYLLADFAAENLNGLYIGGHSRTYPDRVLNQWLPSATGIAWLVFGNTPFRPRGEAAVLAMSGYHPPEILDYIATDRTRPYVHKEYKRTRHRLRHSELRNAPVYKYNYICQDYALGSLQGGLLQPIQQHTWDVTWATADPQAGYNTLFTIHPYSSGYELSMYFPEETKLMTKSVLQSKGTYDSPDKWTGASPFEQVVQEQDALIVLYDIPPDTRFSHVSGFFPKTLARRESHPSGWIFAQGGAAYIAYFPLAKYQWIEEDQCWRLHSTQLKNGAVVQVAPAGEYASFDEFRQAVLQLPLKTKIRPTPQVQFTSLRGDPFEFTYGKVPKINGQPVDYENWKLFEGPFLLAEKGSKTLEMRYGQMRRLLDFNTLTIKEWIE